MSTISSQPLHFKIRHTSFARARPLGLPILYNMISPLEVIDLGVGETIPRGIPPGETDLLALAAPLPAPLAGEGARKLDVGGFNRDLRMKRRL